MSCRFVALSLFFFFVRETVETLRLLHISLTFTGSYKVSSKFQSFKVPSFFFFSIATLFMFFYPAYSFFLPVPFFALIRIGHNNYCLFCFSVLCRLSPALRSVAQLAHLALFRAQFQELVMFCFAFSRSHSRSACSPRAPSLFELPSQGNSPDPVMVALKCLFFPHLAYFFIYRFAYKKQQHLSTLLLIKGLAKGNFSCPIFEDNSLPIRCG